MINRNGSGKTHTHSLVLFVYVVFFQVLKHHQELVLYLLTVYIYILHTHIHTEEKGLAQWRCVYKCVCVPTLLFNSF